MKDKDVIKARIVSADKNAFSAGRKLIIIYDYNVPRSARSHPGGTEYSCLRVNKVIKMERGKRRLNST